MTTSLVTQRDAYIGGSPRAIRSRAAIASSRDMLFSTCAAVSVAADSEPPIVACTTRRAMTSPYIQ